MLGLGEKGSGCSCSSQALSLPLLSGGRTSLPDPPPRPGVPATPVWAEGQARPEGSKAGVSLKGKLPGWLPQVRCQGDL